MANNTIENHDFLALFGHPDLPKQILEIISRNGVEGVAVRKLNKKSRPFTVTSQVDAKTISDGRKRFRDYLKLVGDDPVEMMWGGVDIGSAGM